ncbi:hypothetical protein QYZ87_04715 [Porphyromonadaceae bacterium W3.11]|nr:hypothetical protein [Porphyromonadaceae bacterium W3.11]
MDNRIYYAVGGYADLFKFPPRKKPLTNNWNDEDGLEVDLRVPLWDIYNVELRVVYYPNAYSLIDRMSDKLGDKAKYLIPVSISNHTYKYHVKISEATIIYQCIKPIEFWQDLSYERGSHRKYDVQDHTLNDIKLGDMGILVNEVWDDLKFPQLYKEHDYGCNSLDLSGVEVYQQNKKKKTREIAARCTIPFSDKYQLLGALAKLAEQVTQPDEQKFDGMQGYYTRMDECSITRNKFEFTFNFQLI